MRFIPTRIHGLIDYVWSILLIVSPFLLGFAGNTLALWIAVAFGVAGIAYSLLTQYELGALKLLPMRLHLGLDGLAGVLLVLLALVVRLPSPAFWTFLIFGLFAIVASLITRTSPAPRPALRTVGGTN